MNFHEKARANAKRSACTIPAALVIASSGADAAGDRLRSTEERGPETKDMPPAPTAIHRAPAGRRRQISQAAAILARPKAPTCWPIESTRKSDNQSPLSRSISGPDRARSARKHWTYPPRPMAPCWPMPRTVQRYGRDRTSRRFAPPARTAPSACHTACSIGTSASGGGQSHLNPTIARHAGGTLTQHNMIKTGGWRQFYVCSLRLRRRGWQESGQDRSWQGGRPDQGRPGRIACCRALSRTTSLGD